VIALTLIPVTITPPALPRYYFSQFSFAACRAGLFAPFRGYLIVRKLMEAL
jgi:hypothetical protein